MWCLLLVFFALSVFLFLVFYTEYIFYLLVSPVFLHGDDVLCRLLSCLFPSVCFSYFFSLTVLLVWCVYLVTTAGFVADQLIMCDK